MALLCNQLYTILESEILDAILRKPFGASAIFGRFAYVHALCFSQGESASEHSTSSGPCAGHIWPRKETRLQETRAFCHQQRETWNCFKWQDLEEFPGVLSTVDNETAKPRADGCVAYAESTGFRE